MAPCSTKSASQSGERDVFEQPQNVTPRTSLGHHQAPLKTHERRVQAVEEQRRGHRQQLASRLALRQIEADTRSIN